MEAPELDPLIHQRTRLQIMAALHRNREASFTDLRDGLELTPGNLKSHADKLEEAGYVHGFRKLVGTSFEARYRITEEGSAAFRAYVDRLGRLLGGASLDPVDPDDAEAEPSQGRPGPAL